MPTYNSYKKEIEQLINILQEKFSNESTGHDWYHLERVYKIAVELYEKEGGNLAIISFAALLHDISDHKFNGGDSLKGGVIARQILVELGIDEEIISTVQHIVDNISYKGGTNKVALNSIEGKIVQDADRLDAIGAIGIARTFAYGGFTNQPIYDPKIKPKTFASYDDYKGYKSHTINHFYEKLLLLKSSMNTEHGKKIAEERHSYMENFLKEFYKEWNVEL